MKKATYCAVVSAAVIGAVLTSTAASAAVSANASADPAATIVTFVVGSGELTITAPGTATLTTGSGLPGTSISGGLGTTMVTDDRALLAASWTVSVSSTDFTTGGEDATSAQTIPADDVTYTGGAFTPGGTISVSATPLTLTLSNDATSDVYGTAGVGDNSATWNPTLDVAIPGTAVGGTYTGTVTQSVL
jgi:hypothetical protein